MTNYLGTWTLFKKEIRRFTEVWSQTIAAPVISNVLFLAIFGVALGGRESGFESFTYLEVLIPGLIAMGLMTNAFGNPVGSIMIGKYTNVITELLTLPLRGIEIASAYLMAGMARGALVGLVTLLVGAFFAPIHLASPLFALLFTVLIGVIFAGFGVMVAIYSATFDQSAIIQNFVLTPLIYLGGVFYAIDSLPPLMQTVSRFNPVFYMVDGLRFGYLGVSEVSPVFSLIVTAFVCFIAVFGSTWMLHTGYKLKQ